MPLLYQIHKYKSGHQLVAGSVVLDRTDQDTLDRLSDISGQLKPGEMFDPYFTCYPLPSQRYFVVARTWQDLTAPRAGCVLTKSIIIANEEWENLSSVLPLFEALETSLMDLKFPDVRPSNYRIFLPPMTGGPQEELVEALFLEQRKPIVIFDCTKKEQLLIRLYDVLWPELKKKFATCTFALAPRSISNRPFDLLFTTGNARTRFSEWNGRRIEGADENRKPARHKWTYDLTKRIFRDTPPSLFDKDQESLFNLMQNSNESTLRLSLLWDELFAKAKFESSPMAILGLLDIINTQPVFEEKLYKIIQPQIDKAVKNAPENLEVLDAWKFYAGLLVKHKRKLMGRNLLLEVKSACTHLTLNAPVTAIEFISNFNPSREKIPSILYASIGDGLALYAKNHTLSLFDNLSERVAVSLLAASRGMAAFLMQQITDSHESLSFQVQHYLNYPDEKVRTRARKNVQGYISSPKHLEITELLLEDATFTDYKSIVSTIGKNTLFENRNFDDVILKSTNIYQSEEFVLSLLSKYEGVKNHGLLIRLLQTSPNVISGFLIDSEFSPSTRNSVIPEVIEGLDENDLRALGRQNVLAEIIFNILGKDKKVDKVKFAEFVLVANIDLSVVLKTLASLQADIINKLRFPPLFEILKRGLLSQKYSVNEIKLLSKLDENRSEMAFSEFLDLNLDETLAKRFLETSYSSGPCFKRAMIRRIDKLSMILYRSLSAKIDDKVVRIWGSLIRATNNIEKQREAAAAMLGYAFNKTTTDFTPLTLIAYPIVYKAYKEDRTFGQTLVGWMFNDWDRCKTLRHDLVDRYVDSKWSAIGLFQVAKKSGIIKDVFSILGDSKKGRFYLENASKELFESGLLVDKTITKQLRKYQKNK